MRLANRVLLCALAIFVLAAVASAQRSVNDPRNQSPSVGTGGPEGGPTGLFTIYDGDTLRKGEFTFSIAYSDYARDPGNVDITDVPFSFNIGLTNRIELFFKTTALRGIKVNSPLNLSGFYLPNSQVFFSSSLLGSPPAIILAPSGPNVGTLAGTAIFRPPFCPGCVAVAPVPVNYYTFGQPFVGFPFTGGIGPNFGLSAGPPGGIFGFPGFSALLGPPTTNGNSFGAADTFPGVGSPVGSILPGVVLATRTLPATLLTNPIVVPTSFTVAPSYLPDAPFINRLYGQSSLNDLVVGGKIRLTKSSNPLGFGFIPFYRWWMDKADDASGFNQLQRGAGPGGNLGDFGLVMFVDGRLSRSVNLSANVGYILNSNPKNNGSTLLDRPNELIAGVGVDFPINKHIQPIAEFRSTQYVGGHTPNAFQNNPVEFLAGLKVYPRRWFGLGAWYRRQLNQQSQGHFNPLDATLPVNQVTGVRVGGTVFVVPGTSVTATSGGFPLGFVPSDNPQGFGAQLWFGHRKARVEAVLPNQPPVISSFAASNSSITLPCPPGSGSPSCPATAVMSVTLTTSASDPDGDTLLYTYTVTGGRVTGEGASVTWDLSGVTPGTYTATVEVDDGCGCITSASTTVTVATCPNCTVPCPTVNVSCPDSVQQGSPATFTANVSGGPGTQTYSWTVSNGTITGGQGTSSITVDTTGKAGQSITATVALGGLDPSCPTSFSCTTQVSQLPAACSKFDEYGNLRFNDEKARLDNFAIQLQNQPGAQGYYIIFGSCEGEADQRSARAVDYLVNTRGIDRGRITVINGGCRETLTVELWICPSGAPAPTPANAATVSPCPECKVKPKPRRRVRRRGEED